MKKKSTSILQKEKRFEELKAGLSDLGLILQGTITERVIQRDDPKQEGKTKAYGPYYQWTFKKEGKTVTQNLTGQQAEQYQKAIENHRTMEAMIQEMRTLSLEILTESIEGVKRRKKPSD